MTDREMTVIYNNMAHLHRFLKIVYKLNLASKEEAARVWGFIHEKTIRWHKNYNKR